MAFSSRRGSRARNSRRRLESLRNTPRITELIILLSISLTPRHCMQKCSASTTSARPSGWVFSWIRSASCTTASSWICGPAHHPLGQPRVLRQADHVGVLVGHDADPELADDRAEVVRAGAAHRDRADDHQLVQVLGVGKLGERGLGHVAALEHLVEVHLGDAARGVVGVVVVLECRSPGCRARPSSCPRPRRAGASSSPGSMNSAMLSLAWKRLRAASRRSRIFTETGVPSSLGARLGALGGVDFP